MKKLFYVLALAAFVACNNSGEGDKKDSDTLKVDTTVVTPPDTTVIDTTGARDSVAK